MQTADRDSKRRPGGLRSLPMLGSTRAFAGGLAAVDANGFVQPATADATLRIVGVFDAGADNRTGGDGAIRALVRRDDDCHGFKDGGVPSAITAADVELEVYADADDTVVRSSTGRPKAGRISEVVGGLVYVRFES